MQEKRNRKRSAKRVVLTVLGILLLLILLLVACVMIYMNHMLNKINKVDPDLEYTLSSSEANAFLEDDPDLVTKDPNSTETHVKLEEITFPTDPVPTDPIEPTQTPGTTAGNTATQPPATKPAVPPETTPSDIYGEHLVNILLVGQDRWKGQSRQRSDTMILVSLNKSDNTITLTSFMRDQYVQIPGYKPNKLNAAYAFGGMRLLTKTLDLNFGVKIDGIVEVDFSGFEAVITLLGGVDVTLNQKEADYLNTLHEFGMLSSPVVVGKNHLDAKQALTFARLREIDTDYARARRQRAVVMGLIEAYKDLPLDEMLSLLDEILPLVSTNLTNSEILGYAVEFFPMLASAKIETLRIPVNGTFSSGLVEVREGFCRWFQYNIDFEANKEVLWEVFRRKD